MDDLPNIALRAYQLWDAAGRPEGQSERFYFEAEEELRAQLDGQIPAAVEGAMPMSQPPEK